MCILNNKRNIAEVIISNTSRSLDKIFHYLIADKDIKEAKIGKRIMVPFGRGNKKSEAFIIGLIDYSPLKELKEIHYFFDDKPFFNEQMLELIKWLRLKYLSTYYEAIKVTLPPRMTLKLMEYIKLNKQLSLEDTEKKVQRAPMQKELVNLLKQYPDGIEITNLTSIYTGKNIKNIINALLKKEVIEKENKYYSTVKEKNIRVAYLDIAYEQADQIKESIQAKAPAQARIIEVLLENDFLAPADLLVFSKSSYNSLNLLYQKGIINYKDVVIKRDPYDYKQFKKTEPFIPTQEQAEAINLINEKVIKKESLTILLRGITGSGKTEVFLQTISQVISQGRQAIVLVPEISLTPQMVERFISRYGNKVAVLHSALSIGERFDQWKKINDGQVDVVVGARSAIFAPFKNLGMIILDEEHENTYKSQTALKYHAREVAEERSKREKAVLILSSATPSIETYYKAQGGQYKICHMLQRYNEAPLPKVEIIDLRNELIKGNTSIFSTRLKEEIEDNIKKGQQVILFLNRRGYSTFVSCRSCGYVLMCPNCNISLTYHSSHKQTLNCHYCGYAMRNIAKCPECKSKYIRYFGTGTQKVEQEIEKLIPNASVIRMDVDTTRNRFAHEKILNTFKEKNINILIGTQMISKGLDFPNVTLVGVLAADMSLNIDDFRASERTFQLITQVCGRAGRGNIEGRAIIQTYQPEHFTIQMAKQHNYIEFYKNEIQIRKQMKYPPFYQIASILVSGTNEKEVIITIKNVTARLKASLKQIKNQTIDYYLLQANPAPISKINNRYRWRTILKYHENNEIRQILRELLYQQETNKKNYEINLFIDINPINML